MARLHFIILAALPTLALAACGSSVIETPGTGGAGASGAGASGVGGALTTAVSSSSSAASSSSTTTSSSSGSGPAACGGTPWMGCGFNEYCHFEPTQECGMNGTLGVCQPKPGGCPPDCPGICGCDGQFYCSACAAELAGYDGSQLGTCPFPEDTYRAVSLFTNVPRFALLKLSPMRNLCFRIIFEPGTTGILAGSGWAASAVELTHDLNDCTFPPGFPPPPVGETILASSAMGGPGFAGPPMCTISLSAAVNFPGAPAWAPLTESFYTSTAVIIEGGCP